MKYLINEIFTSIKGEGRHLGIPMNFIRFATCNLTCDHCDTQFNHPILPMTEEEILQQLAPDVEYVVLTGGEPTLQKLDSLMGTLSARDYQIHLESNGTRPFPFLSFDWVCVSPKLQFLEPLTDSMEKAHEVKMPITTPGDILLAEAFREKYKDLDVLWWLHPWNDQFGQVVHGVDLEPGSRTMQGFNKDLNQVCIDHAIKTGRWGVSIQAHKVLGVR